MSELRAATAVVAAWFAVTAAASADELMVLNDPRGDDYGPGTYIAPTGSQFRRGDFDLRRFTVRVEGEYAIFQVVVGAPIRDNVVRQRTNASALDLSNGIYVQHVDIYVDNKPGAGFAMGLPGRRIAFAPEEAWDVAITLTPLPGPTRTVLRGWNKDAAEKVLTPGPIRSAGATLTARVPLWQLGGKPEPTWGWSVMVSGAQWSHSFMAVERLRGAYQPDAFTLPVVSVPEDEAFGGATLGGDHPYVIDVLLPEGATQEKVLGSYGYGRPAVVPMVYSQRRTTHSATPSPSPTITKYVSPDAGELSATLEGESTPRRSSVLIPRPSPRADIVLEIANVQGDTVVIPTTDSGVKEWQIGSVLDRQGRLVGRVVVTNVSASFVLATLTEGKGRVAAGNRVRFELPAQQR